MGFDIVDINMGCPVRKVVNAGGGSALLKTPELISRILDAARAATNKPLSVKYRIGYTHENISVEDTTNRALRAGFQMVTIHGRTRSDDYSKPVSLEGIRRGVHAAKPALVVFGNGNVFTHSDAEKMMAETACDGVMVSRGVMGNPWVFSEINSGAPAQVSLEQWLNIILRHMEYQEETYGDTPQAAILMRKHLLSYAKGFPGTKHLRGEICKFTSLRDLRNLFREFCKSHPGHTARSQIANEL
jgi:nifR3 family TIM-barrel protein